MTTTPLDAESLLRELTNGEVSFIVIGGLALGAHGFERATKDIDIVPEHSPENLARLAAVLRQLDYELVGMGEFDADELVRPDVDNLIAGGNWALGTRFGRLDILQFVEPDMDYSTLATDAIEAEVCGLRVRLAGYDHLVAMKEAAGRPQDLIDLERLRAIRGES